MFNLYTCKQKSIGVAIPSSIGCSQNTIGIVSNSYFVF